MYLKSLPVAFMETQPCCFRRTQALDILNWSYAGLVNSN